MFLMNKNKFTCLVDMDNIIVDMVKTWLSRYNEIKGTSHTLNDVKDYDVGKLCTDTKTLYALLDEEDFFYNLDPTPGAVEYFQKLVDEGYDMVVVTQPPRRADRAIYDKRRWLKRYFPNFDSSNVVYCHRKDMIRGDILFDDRPSHLEEWKVKNPNGITATLLYHYNKDCLCDWRFPFENGWEQFYYRVTKLFR